MKDDGAFLIFFPRRYLTSQQILYSMLLLFWYASMSLWMGLGLLKSTCGDLVFLPLRSFKGNPLGIQHRSYDIADRDP